MPLGHDDASGTVAARPVIRNDFLDSFTNQIEAAKRIALEVVGNSAEGRIAGPFPVLYLVHSHHHNIHQADVYKELRHTLADEVVVI